MTHFDSRTSRLRHPLCLSHDLTRLVRQVQRNQYVFIGIVRVRCLVVDPDGQHAAGGAVDDRVRRRAEQQPPTMTSVGADDDHVHVDLRLFVQHLGRMAAQDPVFFDAKGSAEPFEVRIRLLLDGFVQYL